MKTTPTLIIGDIHGCIDEFEAMLKLANLPKHGQVVLAGDLVAKGPDSRGVIRKAIEIEAWSVKGNHDAHVLRARAGKSLRKEHQAVADSLGENEWAYLEALPDFLRLPEHNVLVVHGGFLPNIPIDEQREDTLINLRSIRPDGSPSKEVEDGVPWASMWAGPETVVFGHDARRKLQRYPLAFGLDTGCVYGGELTALLLPERKLLSVRAARAYTPIER